MIVHRETYHHESLVKAIKQVDGVISALGSPEEIADQVKIVAAIKEAENIKARHISFPNLFNIFSTFFSLFCKVAYLVFNNLWPIKSSFKFNLFTFKIVSKRYLSP